MNENSRCSILFHLLVPGGKWQTMICRPVPSAALQLDLPQFGAVGVRAAAIGGDRQRLGVRVALPAEVLPPAQDRVDRELGRVAVDADVDPALVA